MVSKKKSPIAEPVRLIKQSVHSLSPERLKSITRNISKEEEIFWKSISKKTNP
jgi:hypothetical protein